MKFSIDTDTPACLRWANKLKTYCQTIRKCSDTEVAIEAAKLELHLNDQLSKEREQHCERITAS
jgi:hypothetical protein